VSSAVRSGAWTSASARRAGRSSQSAEPGVVVEKALEGRKPRRAPARSAVRAPSGESPGAARGRSRERTPEGSKASKRAKRPYAGEPEGLLSAVEVASRGNSWGGQAVSTIAGKPRSRAHVRPGRPPHGGLRARQGGGARRKPVGQPRDLRAGGTVDVEPARKQRPPRGGAAPREGKALEGESQGRLRHETRPRSFGA